ncbi:hypothetical protein [Micrococcus luteus]|uniref:hypothetical protein n=1 Tax=Micrococcus luteus TaxID=1270 RepID=UPI003679163E
MVRKSLTRLTTAGAVFAILLSTSSQAAALTADTIHPRTAVSETAVSISMIGETSASGIALDELDESSLTARIEKADSFNDVRKLLIKDGYRIDPSKSTRDTVMFSRTINGVTGHFEIWTQKAKDRMAYETPEAGPMAKIGWNWSKGGPFIEATPNEWLTLAKYGSGAAVGLCTLITNVFGAAACGVVGGIVQVWLGERDASDFPAGYCIAVSITRRVWVERC